MYQNLDGVETSEYNNAGALFGINENSEEFLGALKKMNPVKRAKVVSKLANPTAPSRGSRAEMEKHFTELPQHVKDQLTKGDLRLADTIIYAVKPLSQKTTKLFEPQDTRQVNLRSLSEARLPKSQVLLVSGIIMLVGVAATESSDDAMRTNMVKVESVPALANGEFSLKANKKIIVPEGTSNRIFCTENFHGGQLGYYKLSNPRLIHDDVTIEFTIDLGTVTGIAANTQVYVGLVGTITTP